MTALNTIAPEVLVALAKAVEAEAKPIKLAPGTYPVSERFEVTIEGVVTKGNDVLYTPTAEVPLIPTLALVLEKAGIMRDRAVELIVEAMTAAITAEENAGDAIRDRIKDAYAAEKRVKAAMAALPKKTKAGATRVAVELTVAPVAAPAVPEMVFSSPD